MALGMRRAFFDFFCDNLEFLLTRRILINGRRAEEVRVAITDNQTLEDYEIEAQRSGLLRNNIYRGVVSNIAPSLNAAFVDFGDAKNGFLAFNDVVESVYCKPAKDAYRIGDVLEPGQELIVQVIKDAGGPKGAQVTTNISLAGRYLVLRPKDAKSGVSRKVDEDARADLTQKVRSLDLPEGYGCIVRTNAMDQSRAILLRDAKALVQLWHKIEAEAARGCGPQLLYNDQDIVVSVMRDYFDSTINEVLIDDKSCYERAMTYVRAAIPSGKDRIRLYEDKMPIFSRFGIEKQIEQIYARQVALPGGGYIVIDPTEALTAIDVNSAHATKRENQDLTAYHTNLEAAAEIGRQLRMRDIGGLIVVDFIDMRSGKHQRDVERMMRNAMARDKARNKVERISANGLLEINRQRISQALSQRMHLTCPTCGGRGTIPSAEAIGLSLMREIDARAASGNLGGVNIKLHPDIAQQLQNERRRDFAQIETEYGIRIEIIATREMSRGEEAIEWLTKKQIDALRPEKTAVRDAASIIDVARVYETQDDSDDAYRPNDYEEFAGDDARRKRASRRARRRDAARCCVCESCANKPQDIEDYSAASEEAEEDLSKRRLNRDDQLNRSADGGARRRSVSCADVAAHKPQRIADIGTVAGLAVLAALIGKLAPHMNEAGDEDRMKRRFSARRRPSKRPNASGIPTDFRMFVWDLAKAVCVRVFGLSDEIARKDMAERLGDVASYFESMAEASGEERDEAVSRLRAAITSRHASSRLSNMFDAEPEAPADEMAAMLLAARDKVVAHIADRGMTGCAEAAETALMPSIARFLGDNNNAGAAQDNRNSSAAADADEAPADSYTVADAIEALPEDARQAADASADAPQQLRQMRRSIRRRSAISEQTADLPSEIALPAGNAEAFKSPYIADNEPVVTADVAIASMTPAETVNADRDESLISTSEMPAVSRSRRSRSRDRKRIDQIGGASRAEDAIAPALQAERGGDADAEPSEAKAAETSDAPRSDDAPEGARRRVRRSRGNICDSALKSDGGVAADETRSVSAQSDAEASDCAAPETTAADENMPRRRERRARRPEIGGDNAAKSGEAAETAVSQCAEISAAGAKTPISAEQKPKSRRLRSERKNGQTEKEKASADAANATSEAGDAACPAPRNDSAADKSAGRSVRRVRKVSAVSMNLDAYAQDEARMTPSANCGGRVPEHAPEPQSEILSRQMPPQKADAQSERRSADAGMTDAQKHEAGGSVIESADARSEKDGGNAPRARRTRTVRAKLSGNDAQPTAADAEESDTQPDGEDVAAVAAPRERRARQTRRTRPNGDQNA